MPTVQRSESAPIDETEISSSDANSAPPPRETNESVVQDTSVVLPASAGGDSTDEIVNAGPVETIAAATEKPNETSSENSKQEAAYSEWVVIVSGTNLNVRTGPGTENERIGTVGASSLHKVLQRNQDGTWIQIDFVGQPGWISAQYTNKIILANNISNIASDAVNRLYYFPVQPQSSAWYPNSHHDYPAADIQAPLGTSVVAVTNGVIDEVSNEDTWSSTNDHLCNRGGLSISLIGDDGVRYYGSHLLSIKPDVVPGLRVRAGEIIGYVGSSGNAKGVAPHLHFGISRPTGPNECGIRRGEILPFSYLRAWKEGINMVPVLLSE